MRDPDLVQRAERAAIALERAWGRWRVMHGLGTDPLPPVSSYVGYSLEEPYGQPRVVFGVGADEAEKLAALLDGHDCVGPVHAEVTGRADRRTARSDMPAPAGSPFDGVPAQASQPASEDVRASARPKTSDVGTDLSAGNVRSGDVSGSGQKAGGSGPAAGASGAGYGTSGYGTSEPGSSEPGSSEHGTSEHGSSEPGTSEHGSSEHGTSEHGTAGPGSDGAGRARGDREGASSGEAGYGRADDGGAGLRPLETGSAATAAGGAVRPVPPAPVLPQVAARKVVAASASGPVQAAPAARLQPEPTGRPAASRTPEPNGILAADASPVSGPAPVAASRDDRASADAGPVGLPPRPPLSRMFPAAPLLPVADHPRGPARHAVQAGQEANGGPDDIRTVTEPEGTVPFPAVDQSGIVAFRRRQDQLTEQFSSHGLAGQRPPSEPFPASSAGSVFDPAASPGPGYRGPRYRGFPPQYQPAPAGEAPAADLGETEPAPDTQPGLGEPRPVSSLGRQWRPGPGAHEAGGWPHGEHAATDTAV